MNRLVLLLAVLFSYTIYGQEIRANVSVNAEQIPGANQQLFRTLQQSLTEFLNETTWTDQIYANQERINCDFILILNEVDSNRFSGTLQVQASRPVYGSTYQTSIYNYNDRQV